MPRFSTSSPEKTAALPGRDRLFLALLAVLSVAGYLFISQRYYRVGFPLDDAWIHQVYARTLIEHGEWAFRPGQPSAGSTSPLWSVLLAVGFPLRLAPYCWAYLIGGFLLWGIALAVEKGVRQAIPAYRPPFPFAGALLTLEWHLVWAAVSGMETLLYGTLVTVILLSLMAESRRYVQTGFLIGISLWVRPDGITLLAPAVLTALLAERRWRQRGYALLGLFLGCGALILAYLVFNLTLSGVPWPNTFYAKQAEYAVLRQAPLLKRYFNQWLPPLTGAGILLLPGAIVWLVVAWRRRAWGALAGMFWFVAYLGLYAWRLPVTYQHGRYVMPAMGIFFAWGLLGLWRLATTPASPRGARLAVMGWRIGVYALVLLFWVQGGLAYARDVAFIESEMVATARWVEAHLPPQALVAAHDIGALGYFDSHPLLDLAGLVSPQVIPFLRDEARLAQYLDEQAVDYLVVFPDWYPSLTAGRAPIFETHAPYAPAQGGTNMAVYRWKP